MTEETAAAQPPYRELLLGCGHSREKKLRGPGDAIGWRGLTTADIVRECTPDMIVDASAENWWNLLSYTGTSWGNNLDDTFDEVHAYDVIEHLGYQGNVLQFFRTFYGIWRLLKPAGRLFAICPGARSRWLWGDPGHTRAILPESLVFLDRDQYTQQLGRTPISDYRSHWGGDFRVLWSREVADKHEFCLEAVKPVREYGK